MNLLLVTVAETLDWLQHNKLAIKQRLHPLLYSEVERVITRLEEAISRSIAYADAGPNTRETTVALRLRAKVYHFSPRHSAAGNHSYGREVCILQLGEESYSPVQDWKLRLYMVLLCAWAC